MRPVILQPSVMLQWQKKMLFNQCVDAPVPWSSLRLPVCAGTWGSSLPAVLLSIWSYLQHFLQMSSVTPVGRIWWAVVLYWCTFSFFSFPPLLVSCGCTPCPSSRGVRIILSVFTQQLLHPFPKPSPTPLCIFSGAEAKTGKIPYRLI